MIIDNSKKSSHRKCKIWDGSLVNFEKNITAFFKAWLGIKNYKIYSSKELKKRVLQSNHIPIHIKMNVTEAIDIVETAKLPQDWETFIVDRG